MMTVMRTVRPSTPTPSPSATETRLSFLPPSLEICATISPLHSLLNSSSHICIVPSHTAPLAGDNNTIKKNIQHTLL